MASTVEAAEAKLDEAGALIRSLRDRLAQVVVGQDHVIDQLLACSLAGSHALLVGVPGLAKTLLVKALATSFNWSFHRIQFTPDLMPADVTGYELLHRDASGNSEMRFRQGPIFTNLLLADEINRAAPKTQSALLEAMAERQVTVGGQTYRLPQPFLVVATQNPIEQEGTYPLPEAQLDRFMMQIHIDYPTPEQEEQIVMRTAVREIDLGETSMTQDQFLALRELVQSIPLPESTVKYAVRLCTASRPNSASADARIQQYVGWGAGPRGSQNLVAGAAAHALLAGRPSPSVEDVKAVAHAVLRHRVVPNHRAIGDGIAADDLVDHLIKVVG